MERAWTIRGKKITDESPPYVVAELSHNHQGNVEIACEMTCVAKECGADAVKLQKRSPAFYDALRGKGLTEYADLREGRELSEGDYRQVRGYAHSLGLAFLATAFDEWAVWWVTNIGVDGIKLASGSVHNSRLLEAAAKTWGPLLVSTGCADHADISRAVSALENNSANFALLQCTSAYPPKAEDMNLRVIQAYREQFPGITISLSSHRVTNDLEPIAYALGARVFEKHFTLSRQLGAGDHANSLDPEGLRGLVVALREAREALGSWEKRFLPCEEEGRRRLDVTYKGKLERHEIDF